MDESLSTLSPVPSCGHRFDPIILALALVCRLQRVYSLPLDAQCSKLEPFALTIYILRRLRCLGPKTAN